jgi:hypothetical protein
VLILRRFNNSTRKLQCTDTEHSDAATRDWLRVVACESILRFDLTVDIELACRPKGVKSSKSTGRGVNMDTLLGSKDSLKSKDAVTRRVTSDAKQAYGRLVDDAFLELAAYNAVLELWRDSIKVTAFVPVLAMRRIRETVDAQISSATGPGQ